MNIKPEHDQPMMGTIVELVAGSTFLFKDSPSMITDIENSRGERLAVTLNNGLGTYLRITCRVELITVNATWRRSP